MSNTKKPKNAAPNGQRHPISHTPPSSPYDLRLTLHAIDRMRKHKISRDWVFLAMLYGTPMRQNDGRIRYTLSAIPKNIRIPEGPRRIFRHLKLRVVASRNTIITTFPEKIKNEIAKQLNKNKEK